MKYDFTTVINRRGMDSIAVDIEETELGEILEDVEFLPEFDRIPMWVADMCFATVPAVRERIVRRVDHGVFGYFAPSEEYYQSIINWQKKRNKAEDLKKEHIGYENGVLGGVASALRVLCCPGAPVLVHSPAYNGFIGQLERNGYRMVVSPLYKDDKGVWRMDYEDMEKRIRDNHIHTAILCSPHNPCGRVWEKWELDRAMEIYKKYDVYVISDEIWSDLTLFGNQHIPTQSVSQDAKNRTIALYAPSKTFNLAGLIGSYHIIYNSYLRDRIREYESLCHYNDMNVLSMHALIGAYQREGEEWLLELREALEKNVLFACDFIRENFKGVEAARPEGTYILWLNCEKWCEEHGKTVEELQRASARVGVLWREGGAYLAPSFIRLNLAMPYAKVVEAFERMKKYVFV